MKTEFIKFKVTHQGALKINHAYIYKKGSKVCAVAVDMKSKHGEISGDGSDDDVPNITVEAVEGSINMRKSVDINEPTVIEFPDFRG